MGNNNDSNCRCCRSRENDLDFDSKENNNIEKLNNSSSQNNNIDENFKKDLKSYVTFKNFSEQASSSLKIERSSENNSNSNNEENNLKSNKKILKKSNDLIKQNNYYEKYNNNNNSLINQNNINNNDNENNNNNDITEEDNLNNSKVNNSEKIILIQSVYKGYYYRSKIFPDLKIELENHLDNLLQELYSKYLTPNLKNCEFLLGIKNNQNSYKKLLTQKNNFYKKTY